MPSIISRTQPCSSSSGRCNRARAATRRSNSPNSSHQNQIATIHTSTTFLPHFPPLSCDLHGCELKVRTYENCLWPAGRTPGPSRRRGTLASRTRTACVTINEHGTIYAISSDFGDRMITQSMGLMVLLSEHF